MTIRCTARVVSEAVVLSLLLSVCSAEAPAINDDVLKSLSLPGVREPRVMRLEDLGDYWQRQFFKEDGFSFVVASDLNGDGVVDYVVAGKDMAEGPTSR
jgi:hypothetical protein